jgi:RNA polymerase sigma factor (sigma-70 family)
MRVNRRRYTRRVIHPGGRGRFATTRWSLVLAAGADLAGTAGREALTALCETYWYPLYAFLRGRGHSTEDAEDLTQAFFARVLEKNAISQADPSRGRFRSFLLASLTHFAANEHDRDIAKKRGGGVRPLSLEFLGAEGRFQMEPASEETPEKIFDRRWALTLLERVLSRLETDVVRSGGETQFSVLKNYLTGEEPQLRYADTARELGMSEGAVKVAVHRLRRRFRDLVRDEISHTVSLPDEIEDELRHLWAAIAR